MRKILYYPGPWQWYFKIGDNLEADCGVYYEERPGMVYAICRAPRYEGEQQWKANARLIAAAPDLLELLKESQHQISGDWRKRRDDLIAKAEGKEGA